MAVALALGLYRQLLDLCGLIAGVMIGALALMVSADVVIRNLGAGGLPWALEVAEYILYVSTFLGAPWVLARNAHVRVDVFVSQVPASAAHWADVAVDLVGLLVSLVLLYFGATAAIDAHRIGALIFKELIVPEWWLLTVIPFSAALLTVEFCLRLSRRGTAADAPTIDAGF